MLDKFERKKSEKGERSHSWACDVLDDAFFAFIRCCLPRELCSVASLLSFGCQFFLCLRKKVTSCFSDSGVWKSCLLAKCTNHASLCPWGDACAARSPGHASVPRGHHGELGILQESPSRESRPRIAFLSLAGASYCCSRVQYTWASIWFSSNPQEKKRFPCRMLVMWIRNTWSSLGPGSCRLFAVSRGCTLLKRETWTTVINNWKVVPCFTSSNSTPFSEKEN